MNTTNQQEQIAAALPVRIENEEQHKQMLAVTDKLMRKGEDCSPGEHSLLKLLVHLIKE